MAAKTVLNPAGKDPRERSAYRRLCREIGEALMPDDVTGEDDDSAVTLRDAATGEPADAGNVEEGHAAP